jgi:hypothetical protein
MLVMISRPPLSYRYDFGFPWSSSRAHHAAVSTAPDGIPHALRGYQTLSTVAFGEQPNQPAAAVEGGC